MTDDGHTDDDTDRRWMSIAELAESRGITKPSAWRLAYRRSWHRQKANDGTVRVYVPLGKDRPQTDSLGRPNDSLNDNPTDTAPDMSAVVSAKDEVIRAHESHIASLRDALANAETRAAAAEAHADELQRQLDQWRMAGWWRRRRLRRS
jgi:hypothetical protein